MTHLWPRNRITKWWLLPGVHFWIKSWLFSWFVRAKTLYLEGLTAPHQQAVDDRGRTTPAKGPHSEVVVNLKRSIRDAQAEDRGALRQLRPSSGTAENMSSHQAKQHPQPNAQQCSVAEKPERLFARCEERSAVTTTEPAPGTNNQQRPSPSLLTWVAALGNNIWKAAGVPGRALGNCAVQWRIHY